MICCGIAFLPACITYVYTQRLNRSIFKIEERVHNNARETRVCVKKRAVGKYYKIRTELLEREIFDFSH